MQLPFPCPLALTLFPEFEKKPISQALVIPAMARVEMIEEIFIFGRVL